MAPEAPPDAISRRNRKIAREVSPASAARAAALVKNAARLPPRADIGSNHISRARARRDQRRSSLYAQSAPNPETPASFQLNWFFSRRSHAEGRFCSRAKAYKAVPSSCGENCDAAALLLAEAACMAALRRLRSSANAQATLAICCGRN